MLPALLLGTLLLAGCASSRLHGSHAPFFFIQMSDPQFGMYTNDHGFARETAQFEQAIAAANRLHPAFVVVCGDLVNQPDSPAQVAEYRRIAARLDPSIPLYNVAGNHDVGKARPDPRLLARYREVFGKDYYHFVSGDLYGIVLNSSLFFDPSLVGDEAARQEAWLRRTLKQARRRGYRHIVVFQHIPWFLENPDEQDQYFNIPLERRQRYLALFRRYGVEWIFAGHLHRNALGRDGRLTMVTTGPVGKPLGADPSGLRIVQVRDSGISQRYYPLDALPASVTP